MVYLMLFSLFLAGPAIDDVHTMFRKGEFHMPPRYFHPQLDAIDPHIFIATAQEGEYLKAVTYWHSKETNTYSYYMGVYYLHNPQKKIFPGCRCGMCAVGGIFCSPTGRDCIRSCHPTPIE
ncbi:hypothetical protein [uncultured Desulfovibrio sp.]|uniref:hypothetical protein n=1 Tax=uncultured Desulfovibrio sp. TaxID=167968 RepID=UPI002603A07E|nr:hypothetical protein [uncultured Desulfovibrio sp.]